MTCNARVPPPNPAGYGDSCNSAPNACGDTAAGTIGCDGACNAVPPANPPGYGDPCTSTPNACGDTAAGTIGCDSACNAVTPPAADADGDGTPDCLDQCPADPNKTAPGVCGCGLPETISTFYRDLDADGFGDPAAAVQACSAPAGFVANNSDCDDANATRHPGAAEICNGIDDNCDGQIEESVDADHDGVNDCGADRCLDTRADRDYMPPVPAITLLAEALGAAGERRRLRLADPAAAQGGRLQADDRRHARLQLQADPRRAARQDTQPRRTAPDARPVLLRLHQGHAREVDRDVRGRTNEGAKPTARSLTEAWAKLRSRRRGTILAAACMLAPPVGSASATRSGCRSPVRLRRSALARPSDMPSALVEVSEAAEQEWVDPAGGADTGISRGLQPGLLRQRGQARSAAARKDSTAAARWGPSAS